VEPFSRYPAIGDSILKKMGRTNARREDGLWLMENTGQISCAYCKVSLVDEYYHWLLLNVDHVVPVKECERLGIPVEWRHSFTNAVLACFGCNLFDNRYSISWQTAQSHWTVEEFITLRNKVFIERRRRILSRKADEVQFFRERINGLDRSTP